MFDLHQNIYLFDEIKNKQKKVAISTLEGLSDTLTAVCQEHKESKIKLCGNTEYANEIASKIKAKYSYIEIEVN
jgi:hypothetical protein